MPPYSGVAPEELIKELERLGKLRKQLHAPYLIFERIGGSCDGDCEKPIVVATIHDVELLCCHVYPGWARYQDVVRLRKEVTTALARGRVTQRPKQVLERLTGLVLREHFSRDFTGTARMRRFNVKKKDKTS